MSSCNFWHDSPTCHISISSHVFLAQNNLIDVKKLHEDDYIDTLPPDEQEIMMDYAASETLC